MKIEITETGYIYYNPKPHLVSRHAYFPSLTILPTGNLFAAFDLGSAFEASDVRSYYSLSRDGGKSWSEPASVPLPKFAEPFSCSCRFRCLPDGELVGIGAIFNRTRIEEGLANPENGGFVENYPFLVRGNGTSLQWSSPEWIETPLQGPFEICSPVFVSPRGEWLWPTSTWKSWEGKAEHGMHAIVMRSADDGKSWPAWNAVMDGRSKGITHWEIKLAGLQDGRLLAVSWTNDGKSGKDIPIHYALSNDAGYTFSAAASTGLKGQTCTPLVLRDGRIFSVYRRTDKPGLWAQISTVEGDSWVNHEKKLLWGGAVHASGVENGGGATAEMSTLRFGLPVSVQLSDAMVMVAFWCVEDAVASIRYFRVQIGN